MIAMSTNAYKKPELSVVEFDVADILTNSSTVTTAPSSTTNPSTTAPSTTLPGSTAPSTTSGGVETGGTGIYIDVSDFFN